MTHLRLIACGVLALLVAAPVAVLAQDSTPTADEGVSVVASDLTNPRGFTWGSDGELIVAEAGAAGAEPPSGTPVPPPVGPYAGGLTARVVAIADGCLVTIAEGLPSAVTATGEIVGVADVAMLGETLYALVTGGGVSHGNPDAANGIYEIRNDGTTDLIVDLGTWIRDNPVANMPEADYDQDGSFFDLTAATDGSALWVVESNSEQVLSVSRNGDVNRVVDLSESDLVPTTVAPAQAGGIYVGFLSGAPFTDGSAKVVEVTPDGVKSDVWTGLTMVTGIAVNAEGTLFASEMATGNLAEPPFYTPGTGRIVRQIGPHASEEVVTGLNLPVSLAIGPDDAFYVSVPAVGGAAGAGQVLRLDPTSENVLIVPDTIASAMSCGDATPSAVAGSEPVTIRIVDFGFEPANVEVGVGTTVTWVNDGPTDHTTVAFVDREKYWDSNIMTAGDEYSFTFEEAGSFDYICGLHPSMTAHIDVVE